MSTNHYQSVVYTVNRSIAFAEFTYTYDINFLRIFDHLKTKMNRPSEQTF